VGDGPGNRLLEQLAVADRPGGAAVLLPLGRHNKRRPTQLIGCPGNGGIGAGGAAVEQAGLSLREVAEISGHRSLAALERYLDQDAAREKAEAARSLLVG